MSKQASPPSWRHVGRHGVFPESSLDDTSRFDFLANLNRHLAERLSPRVRESYEKRVKPQFEKDHGRAPETRDEVREVMTRDSIYQAWSALRRTTMEMRQQAGRALVLRQLDSLIDKARQLNKDADTLQLDPSLDIPISAGAVDIHCQPGGYHTELVDDDVLVGANYDAGLFATTGGMLGRWNDGGGKALAKWLAEKYPQFKPRRILDLGCTVGHNVVPLAQAFPEAEVIGIDVGAPTLRYAHARARSLGVENLTFRQANAQDLGYSDGHFDLITSAMYWHESTGEYMPHQLREIHRMLADGGLTAHLEQPQYAEDMDPYEQFIRDWDTWNNNEPFWGIMHDYDIRQMVLDAGFAADNYFETAVAGVVDHEVFPEAQSDGEDYGRAALWTMFGAWK